MPFAFDPRRSEDRAVDALIRYGGAFVIVLAAAAVRWMLQPTMGAAPPYITFYLAIVAAAAFGGVGPGLLATLLGGLLGVGLANWPTQRLELGTSAEQVRLLLYLLSGLAITLIAGRMHYAHHQVRSEAARLRDLTKELREANDRLRESDRSKDQFLAVLAHELRNPLMPIHNSLALLKRRSDPDGVRRAHEVLDRQVQQMTRLVNDLLDVTRLRHGKLDLRRARIDLREVVGQALDDYRPLYLERRVGLHQRKPSRPVWVHGDHARLTQVVGNLLNNALKFTPAGGDAYVDLEEEDSHAVLRVRDTGMGIPGELLPRIFEPFMQADQPLDRAAGGLGLGLALVRNLVEMHGGGVDGHSAGAGRGAEFRIRLPLDARESPPEEPGPLAPTADAPGRTIVVVEDNLDAAGTLQQLLESHGHRVQVCHSGGEAPDLARRCRAEVVFCDIGLPDLDGYAVARALRADPETSGVLLVALSGYASADAREKAMEAGFDIHLAKPASFAELLAVAAASHRPAGAFVPAELRPTMARHGHRRIR